MGGGLGDLEEAELGVEGEEGDSVSESEESEEEEVPGWVLEEDLRVGLPSLPIDNWETREGRTIIGGMGVDGGGGLTGVGGALELRLVD